MDCVKNRAGKTKQHQQGAAALEAILLTPLILMILYAIAQYSLIFVSVQMFNYAAEESLRSSISYVDSNCYYGGSCDTATLKSQIEQSAKEVVQRYTDADSGLGQLFGQSLDTTWAENDTTVSLFNVDVTEPGNVCCKVTITYNYKKYPFLPSFGLPVPDELKSTATLSL
ncbi:TadE/TadG family type IV pilus assembly protein [Photobacterium sp. 53610]|uniref:TadE/TadG family type IV pilus assembly protein n=1 Tax=Photobacterium sp. 53610 TaxID=3102789 RepID=UPI002EDA95B1